VLAQAVQQNLERYYITIALLTQQGSGRITRQQLEELCSLFAQRLSLLHEFSAPEFFDQAIFRNFIQTLSRSGLLRQGDGDTLVFDVRLQATADEALFVLPAEIRQTIHQMTRIDESALQAALLASAEKTFGPPGNCSFRVAFLPSSCFGSISLRVLSAVTEYSKSRPSASRDRMLLNRSTSPPSGVTISMTRAIPDLLGNSVCCRHQWRTPDGRHTMVRGQPQRGSDIPARNPE